MLTSVDVKSILLTMLSSGVIGACTEKLFISFNKIELANYVNIASISGMAISALVLVAKLISMLNSL